jgi:hypothetical protein
MLRPPPPPPIPLLRPTTTTTITTVTATTLTSAVFALLFTNMKKKVRKLVGFHFRFEYFQHFKLAIGLLAMNLLLLYFKTIKVLFGLVPKCKELVDVLKQCWEQLLCLTLVIGLAIVAFGIMFWILLGSTMSGFADRDRSIITMLRAALGDFDISTIDENSPDATYLNLFFGGIALTQFIFLRQE